MTTTLRVTGCLALALLGATPVYAQYSESLGMANNFAFAIGAGTSYAPDYLGSNHYEFIPLPFVEARWRDRIKLSALEGLTIDLVGDGPVMGARFSYYAGREEDDNNALQGLQNLEANVIGGVYVSYGLGPVNTRLELMHDLGGDRNGTTATMSVSMRSFVTNELRMTLGSSMTWATREYMAAMFGITEAEANDAPLYDDSYTASGGLRDVSLDLSMNYNLSRNWSLLGKLDYSLLLGDVADSPLVDGEGSRHQIRTSIGAIYLW